METIQFIEKVVSNVEDKQLLVNKMIEEMTGCTIYNKNEILKRIDNMDTNSFIQEVSKNIVMELNYEKFKEMGFSIIFVNDNVYVLYHNRKVTSSIVDEISKASLNIPQFPELYIMNLKTIIDKFNNMDISVLYNCSNINVIYWNLFTIKARKRYNDTQFHLNSNKHIKDIISGEIYKEADPEMKYIMKQINMMENNYDNTFDIMNQNDSFSDSDNNESYLTESDKNNEIFKLETISYLNDNQVNKFLSIDESFNYEENKLDYNNKESVVSYIKKLLDVNSDNNMGVLFKIYFVNKIFKCLLNATNFLATNLNFMTAVKNKIKELESEKAIIKFAETNLTKHFIKTLKSMKELIASIEKN
jgi:hypothetical protein